MLSSLIGCHSFIIKYRYIFLIKDSLLQITMALLQACILQQCLRDAGIVKVSLAVEGVIKVQALGGLFVEPVGKETVHGVPLVHGGAHLWHTLFWTGPR